MNKKFVVIGGIVCAAAIAVLISIWFYSQTVRMDQTPPSSPAGKIKRFSGRSLTVLTNAPHLRSAEEIARRFHEQTGCVVRNIVVNYEDALTYTLQDVSSANPQLDVIMFWYADIGALVEKSALRDLTEFIEKNRQILQPQDYIPSIYDAYTLYNGKRWAIPYDGDTHVLFYRQSLFGKYHLKPPETWEDYFKAAQLITQKEKHNGIYGTAIMAPRNPMIIVSSYMNRLSAYGGRLLNADNQPSVNSAEAVLALSDMIQQAAYALPTPIETDWEVSRDAFLSGKAAMVEQWTDIGIMAEDPAQSTIKGDWDVVQMPKGSGPSGRHSPALNSGFSLGISQKTSDPQVSEAYLLFAGQPDITLELNLINGGIDPVRISVLSSPRYRNFAPKLSAAVQGSLQGATPWPRIAQTPRLLVILTDNLIAALQGIKTPQEALDDTQATWQNILDNLK